MTRGKTFEVVLRLYELYKIQQIGVVVKREGSRSEIWLPNVDLQNPRGKPFPFPRGFVYQRALGIWQRKKRYHIVQDNVSLPFPVQIKIGNISGQTCNAGNTALRRKASL